MRLAFLRVLNRLENEEAGMYYRFEPLPDICKKFKDNLGRKWTYLDEKEIQVLYPNGGFKIFGEMRRRVNKNAVHFLDGSEQNLELYGLYPYTRKNSWLKKSIGYIKVTDETGETGYIRVLANAWMRPLLLLCIVVAGASIFLGGVWFANQDETPGLDKTAVSYHIDGVRNTDPESILLPGISRLKVKAGELRIHTALINPEGNTCYFKYIIQLADTKEVLYTSGLIEPGKAVTEFDITRMLKPGEYPVTIIVETRDTEDYETVYNAGNIDAVLDVSE